MWHLHAPRLVHSHIVVRVYKDPLRPVYSVDACRPPRVQVHPHVSVPAKPLLATGDALWMLQLSLQTRINVIPVGQTCPRQ